LGQKEGVSGDNPGVTWEIFFDIRNTAEGPEEVIPEPSPGKETAREIFIPVPPDPIAGAPSGGPA
jgi:hypothetical protein